MQMDRVINFLSEWLSRSGDHTFWSYVITFAYIVTFLMAFAYVRRVRAEGKQYFLWICITVFLFLMGVNKQLDIQTLILMSGRWFVFDLGIRHYWRLFHYVFFYGLIGLFMIAGILVLIKTGRVMLRSLLSAAGVLLLLLFIIMRANYIYMQHIHSLELAGITFIFVDLVIKLKTPDKKSQDFLSR